MRFTVSILMVPVFMLAMAALFLPAASHAHESASQGDESASAQPVRVEDAWIREAPPVAKVNAAYFTLCNQAAVDTVLTGVSSPAFGKIEMHETIEEGGSSRMQELTSVSIPAGECVEFAPGGRHLMLFDARNPVKAGDTFSLRFEFTHSPDFETPVPVRRGNGNNGHH